MRYLTRRFFRENISRSTRLKFAQNLPLPLFRILFERHDVSISIREERGLRVTCSAGARYFSKLVSCAMNLSLRRLSLSLLPERYAIVGLSSKAQLPPWATQSPFFSITRTADELSVVVEESLVPQGVQSEKAWRVIKVHGPFVLSEVGVLAALAGPLAAARVSLFVISTFDTDYLLVSSESLDAAISVLERAGHTFHRSQSA